MSENPPVVPADTTPEAWRVQMRAMAALTPQQRLALWADLNEQVAAMEEAAVRRQHPELDDLGVGLELIRRRHGDALAAACRASL
ncbi:MAG: hypothetical protein ACKO27_09695 [Ilumatobacteraceae bacterium]